MPTMGSVTLFLAEFLVAEAALRDPAPRTWSMLGQDSGHLPAQRTSGNRMEETYRRHGPFAVS